MATNLSRVSRPCSLKKKPHLNFELGYTCRSHFRYVSLERSSETNSAPHSRAEFSVAKEERSDLLWRLQTEAAEARLQFGAKSNNDQCPVGDSSLNSPDAQEPRKP